MGQISQFIDKHFRHFNSLSLKQASRSYIEHLNQGGKMLISLSGAMSTAELGISLAEMIRKDKVHIISCTGANLEEDLMNLIAHSHYKTITNYRELSADDELKLLSQGLNRVTDTCIPEEEAFRKLQGILYEFWKKAHDSHQAFLPHEYLYQILLSKQLEQDYDIDPANSWLLAAAEKNLPLVVPGWEDSTMGNIFASYCLKNQLSSKIIRSGTEYMIDLSHWYITTTQQDSCGVGFFQIGGGIAGDFPICVVPMLNQDMEMTDIPCWKYFCQISDSTTSYGSYSGAIPNEKITWGKLEKHTPKFIIESDATIVAPLMFGYILEW